MFVSFVAIERVYFICTQWVYRSFQYIFLGMGKQSKYDDENDDESEDEDKDKAH